MSVKKPGRVWLRNWKTSKGVTKSAWAVDYLVPDQRTGRVKNHRKQFATEVEALAFNAHTFVETEGGAHVPDSRSCTVAEAGERWLTSVKAKGRERSTTDAYEQHLRIHINPRIGHLRLTELSLPVIADFEDRLRQHLSPAMTRRVMGSLRRMLGNAQVRGLVARNVARDMPRDRGSGRDQEPLRVGVAIPTRDEVGQILLAATGRWRPLVLVAAFTGMRSSELRGLRWTDLELSLPIGKLHVRQRLDAWGRAGPPKSKAGYRTIPLSEFVVNTLMQWKLECPRMDTGQRDDLGRPIKVQHYVFPNSLGFAENHANMVSRGYFPIQIAAGLEEQMLDVSGEPRFDRDGKPLLRGKYRFHALRHFYCSWLIERGKQPKDIQTQMGHSSLVMTLDRYGHLFPREDDAAEMARAEAALLGLKIAEGHGA
jgi:integrase